MTTPIFSETGTLLVVILSIVAFGLWFSKTKIGKNIGPSLTVIILGIIAFNTGVVPAYAPIYGEIVSYCVPVSIAVLLLNVDLKAMLKLSRQPLIAMASAVFSVSLAAFIFGMVFAGKIDEGWKVAGMFVGTYTGGSGNLTAIAVGLDATSGTIAAANAADYVVGMPALLLMFATPMLLSKWKWFHKIWPFHHTEAELMEGVDAESGNDILSAKKWGVMDAAILLALGFAINEIAKVISKSIFPSTFVSAGKILLITTMAFAIGQLPCVKKIKGKIDVGMFLALCYLVIIGFMVDIKGFMGSTLYITLFCLCVMVVCTLIHLLITRVFKIKYEYVVLSIVAAIADGPTAALVAAGGRWGSLVTVGLVCGVLGAVFGNYCGIGVAYLIKAVLGF